MSETRDTGTVLDRIVAKRRERLAEAKAAVSAETLAARAERAAPAIDFAARLRDGRRAAPAAARVRLIAEIKRASPSKGVFDADLDAARQAAAYADAGASAISVLTEPDFFRGSLADLEAARAAFGEDGDRPALLRKDFLFDGYQLLEARAAGADALLLIVAMLEPPTLAALIARTRALGMEPLVEVHDEAELRSAVDAGALVLGVNNRDLRTFDEDLGVFERLSPLMPPAATRVAESAIRVRADAERMAAAGAHAVLVGEALVTGRDFARTAAELMCLPVGSGASGGGRA
jgi:indole-3-glycerol phosphate synthase